jgi:hypothetical protein
MPENAVYVGRPTRWGNPFRAGEPGVRDAADAVRSYELLMFARGGRYADGLRPLRGHDLVCWCPLDQPCHADVLLALANP